MKVSLLIVAVTASFVLAATSGNKRLRPGPMTRLMGAIALIAVLGALVIVVLVKLAGAILRQLLG